MDEFLRIYKVLRFLRSMAYAEEFDKPAFTAKAFGVSDSLWIAILEMLSEKGYVDGVDVRRSADGRVMLSINNPRITFDGLEYLAVSPLMQKAADTLKGIA